MNILQLNRLTQSTLALIIALLVQTLRAFAQSAYPFDESANQSKECNQLITIARECNGLRTDQIARLMQERSFDVNIITTSRSHDMATMVIGNKRYQLGLSYDVSRLCEVPPGPDRPYEPIGCFWLARPAGIKIYCHGEGFTVTSVWDTTYNLANESSAKTWKPSETLRAISLPDTTYLQQARSIQELMDLYDSLRVWVLSVYVDTDSTASVWFNAEEKLQISLERNELVHSEIRNSRTYDMLSAQRIKSIRFLRRNPKNINEYHEVLREINYPETTVTGRQSER